ncbi:hypothetical protein ACLB2K_030953 [Fragaria x ananassa]
MVRSLFRLLNFLLSAVKPLETATLVPKASPSSLPHCWTGGASSGTAVRDKSSSKTPPVRIRCRSNFSFLRASFLGSPLILGIPYQLEFLLLLLLHKDGLDLNFVFGLENWSWI